MGRVKVKSYTRKAPAKSKPAGGGKNRKGVKYGKSPKPTPYNWDKRHRA